MASWQILVNPMGSLQLSALVAALPVFTSSGPWGSGVCLGIPPGLEFFWSRCLLPFLATICP